MPTTWPLLAKEKKFYAPSGVQNCVVHKLKEITGNSVKKMSKSETFFFEIIPSVFSIPTEQRKKGDPAYIYSTPSAESPELAVASERAFFKRPFLCFRTHD